MFLQDAHERCIVAVRRYGAGDHANDDAGNVPQPGVAALLGRTRSTSLALLQCGRIHNCAALAAVGVASALAAYPDADSLLVLAYFGSWTVLFLGIYLLNDVLDVDIDRCNKPWKPIPAGRLRGDVAAKVAAVCLVAGPLLVSLTGSAMFDGHALVVSVSALAVALLGIGYSTWIKRACPVLANCVISGTVAICGVLPGIFGAGSWTFLRGLPVYVFGLLAREFLKDIEDARADHGGGRRTFPVVYGRSQTACLAGGILVLTLAWCAWSIADLPMYFALACIKYVIFVFFGVLSLGIIIYRHDTASCAHAQRWLKPGLLLFLVLDVIQWTSQ